MAQKRYSLFAPQVEKNRRYITMRNKKWIAILMAALILVCGNTVAFAIGNNLFIGIQGGGTYPSYFTPFSVINNYF